MDRTWKSNVTIFKIELDTKRSIWSIDWSIRIQNQKKNSKTMPGNDTCDSWRIYTRNSLRIFLLGWVKLSKKFEKVNRSKRTIQRVRWSKNVMNQQQNSE